MERKIKSVVWDVDGTLLNTSEGIIASVIDTLKICGYLPLDQATMESFIGPPIQHSFQKAFKLDLKSSNQMASVFRKEYKEKNLYKAELYPGMKKLLIHLKQRGVQQAVATYKREDYAKMIVDHFGISSYMDIVCGADFDGKLTKTDIIWNAIQSLKQHYLLDSVVMIGDTMNDAIGAKNLGIPFIAVRYGFGFKSGEELEKLEALKCIGIAENVEELGNLLEG